MWTWLLLVVGVPLLLGWAQSRLNRGFGADAPSSVPTGAPLDEEPLWENQTESGLIGATRDDPFAPLYRWSSVGMQHASLGGDEDGAQGRFGAQTAFCPSVNIDGTPMATCHVDIEGKPYGVTDLDGSLGSTVPHHEDGLTHAHDLHSATGITDTDSFVGADWSSNATEWSSDDWSHGVGWHDSRW
jgi:hypothetical protein